MHNVLAHFESTASDLLGGIAGEARSPAAKPEQAEEDRIDVEDTPTLPERKIVASDAVIRPPHPDDPPITSITDLLPSDPLLNEVLHKIMFALELVVWDRTPEQVVEAPEIKSLGLESWEVETYRNLVEQQADEDSEQRHLQQFFLTSAALRVKMEEERRENRTARDKFQTGSTLRDAREFGEQSRSSP